MPLLTVMKHFQFTDDTTNLLANDQIMGDLGKGAYEVCANIDVADGLISLFDGRSAILDVAPIPIRVAAVTFPEIRVSEDLVWRVVTKTAGAALRINLIDGTTGDGVIRVRALSGPLVPQVPRRRVLLAKMFLVSADVTGLLVGDQVFGDLGKGLYGITPVAAAAADGTWTVDDGLSNVIDAMSIPVRAAAVTFPTYRQLDDVEWLVRYVGAGNTLPIDIVDGTNAEIIVLMRWYGR